MRALWKGSISFGLVNIPVKLYSSVAERGIKLHLICSDPECMGEIGYKKYCKRCGKEVGWSEVKRAYKVAKDKYVVIEEEELNKIKPKSNKIIEIKQFVNREEIEPIFLKKNYYITPDTGGERAYLLLREVMSMKNKCAIGKLALREKEEIVAIYPYRNVLLLTALYYPSEVRFPEEFEIEEVELKSEEIELASLLIDKMSSKLELKEFKDEYSENLKKLVEAKLSGEVIEVKPEEEAKELKDLVSALKLTIEEMK